MNRPVIGITMGDPYGSGADISVKALAKQEIYERCRPIIIGDACCMEYAAQVAEKVSGIKVRIRPVSSVNDAVFECGTIDVLDMKIMTDTDIPKTDGQRNWGLRRSDPSREAQISSAVRDRILRSSRPAKRCFPTQITAFL